ncbi:unnamed protein product [Clavelina lepadiformis]|uniref:Pre-mRNA-splicing factor CWC22 homolog n=1 Tax=Clavelina lepadiformis TaxID=159417 RepID=A0ABP0FB78_CLALP
MSKSEQRSIADDEQPPIKKKKNDTSNRSITGISGGAYIPPAKLRMMQDKITDKNSEEFQRLSWEALKKSINGLINKVNVSNIKDISRELFQENIVRGRGILARSIIMAQNASPTFTHVYATLTSIINARFPQNGELILRRVVAQFRRSYRRNLKDTCLHSVQFIAHLINHQVAHEILALQVLTLLLETPTDDSVEVAVGFLKEVGQKLSEVSPRGLAAVFERLRIILHEQQLEKRVQYMIEVMFAIRKDGFKEHPSIISDLDIVSDDDQFTHMLTIDDNNTKALEMQLNVFRVDPEFEKTEESYKKIKSDILEDSTDGSDSGSDSSSEDGSLDEEAEDNTELEIQDKTETNLVALRRTIYLAIQSSLSFEECAHKILKMEFTEKDYPEICAMIVDCCSQLRTYEKFFGLLGERFCLLRKEFMENFEALFAQQYDTIHRLETCKLRNVAKFFAHLLHSDALPWSALSNIVLSEDTTTSSSRIFIKILFQEISEYMGLTKLNNRLKDPTLAPFFEGIFPRDNPKSTRFAINFFTSIGLGGITDDLREHLKVSARQLSQKIQAEQLAALNVNSSDSSSESSSSESSSEERQKKAVPKKSKKKHKKKEKKGKKAKKVKKKKKVKTHVQGDYDSEASSDDFHAKAVKSTIVQKISQSSTDDFKPSKQNNGPLAKENDTNYADSKKEYAQLNERRKTRDGKEHDIRDDIYEKDYYSSHRYKGR